MARKLPARYECETCHRTYGTLADAQKCEHSHNKAVTVITNHFEKADKFKYPTRIVCGMEDGRAISYYRHEG